MVMPLVGSVLCVPFCAGTCVTYPHEFSSGTCGGGNQREMANPASHGKQSLMWRWVYVDLELTVADKQFAETSKTAVN